MARRSDRPGLIRLDGLVLRPWRRQDVRGLDRAVTESVEHLRPWMPWARNEPVGLRARRAYVRGTRRSWRRGRDFPVGFFLEEEVVGAGGLHARVGPEALEIGYWVHRDHTDRGVATQAAAGLTTLGFTWPGIERIEIHHDEANAASRRVPQKLGFTLVEKRPDPVESPAEIGICWVWTMERARWRDPFGWVVGGSGP